MRENDENWKVQISTVIIEIAGLNEIMVFNSDCLSLLSKLEGLLVKDTEFSVYRKTIFEIISLLQGLCK